jgi:hypothetical protein
MIAYNDLVAVVEWNLSDWLAIYQRAVGGSKVCNPAKGLIRLWIKLARDTSVKARGPRIV